MGAGGTPVVSSEEAAPGSVTEEPPAALPRCDMQQEKSPGGLSGTAHKIEGANCLENMGYMGCRGKVSCDCTKFMECSWEAGTKGRCFRRNKYGKIKGLDKGPGQLETSGWSVCLTVFWARLPQPVLFAH